MSIYVNEVRPNVGAPPITTASPVADDATDYSKMTKAQLATIADERGIDVPKSAIKAEIIELLEGKK